MYLASHDEYEFRHLWNGRTTECIPPALGGCLPVVFVAALAFARLAMTQSVHSRRTAIRRSSSYTGLLCMQSKRVRQLEDSEAAKQREKGKTLASTDLLCRTEQGLCVIHTDFSRFL